MFELRPRRGPAPSRRELATPPAASGGRPGRCEPAALGAAAEVAAGTSRRRCPQGRRAQRRLSAALCSATRSWRVGGGCRWLRRGQQDFGLSCPECFHSVAAAGAASLPEKSEQTRRGRARTLQTWHGGGVSLRFTARGLNSSPEVQRAVQSADFPLRRVAGGCARKQPLPPVFPYTKGEELRSQKEYRGRS